MPVRPHLQKLVERVRFLPPLPTAFVHPCDGESLQLALAGAFAGYLAPDARRPESRIRDAAAKAGLDISRLPIVATADDRPPRPRRDAHGARRARARAGQGRALRRRAARAGRGARHRAATEHRLTHATLLDVPGRAQLLFVTDDRLNVAPTLAAKRDILVNAVELAISLGVADAGRRAARGGRRAVGRVRVDRRRRVAQGDRATATCAARASTGR
jgi:hypothetical protein